MGPDDTYALDPIADTGDVRTEISDGLRGVRARA
jgi:hypothetical protein